MHAEPPSMPGNVEVVNQTATAITLSWDAPLHLGGRDDVSYRLCYQEDEVEAEEESCIPVLLTVAVISGECVIK
jgi:hypothetical protein